MANITEYDEKAFQGFVQELVNINPDIKRAFIDSNLEEPKISINDLNQLTSLFMFEDVIDDAIQRYNNPFYMEYPSATLYMRNSKNHICLANIIINILKALVSQTVFNYLYCQITGSTPNGFTKQECFNIFIKIKEVIFANIISLKGCYLCVYMQFITHLAEHQTVEFSEISEWMRAYEENCSWIEFIHECQCFQKTGESTKCIIKEKNDLQKTIDTLCEQKVLKKINNNPNEYKINF